MKPLSIVVFFFFLSIAFGILPSGAASAQPPVDYTERAKSDAEKAKKDAEKAMMEAEAAIAEAEAAIAKAEKNKAVARNKKRKALERMVKAGHFPEDIAMIAPDGSATAVFSHKKHTAREQLRCIECHPKVFIMKVGKDVVKKGQLTMADMKKGKHCGSCHNGKKAFSVTSVEHCKKCHPK